MKCPKCGTDEQFKCKDSRPYDRYRHRRYLCENCGGRFDTYELTLESLGELGEELDMERTFLETRQRRSRRKTA